MPSSQRLFLMGEQKAMGVKPETFPTYDAEVLAARALETGEIRAGIGLESTHVPGLWKLTANGGRAVGLLKVPTVMAPMHALLNPSAGASFSLILPGGKAIGESVAAGAMLPGWQVALTFGNDHSIEEAAHQRTARYLWIGYLVIAALCLTGLIMAQLFRRQLRLARLKTDLVAAVSHELKTPLASMRLLVDSLLEDPDFDRRKTREYLTLIAGENLRLTRLIENFLTFSRLERNRQHFEFTDVRPSTVVETAVSAVKERFDQPGCRLDVQIEPGLPDFHGDSDALVTVLINLLDNAYKYTRSEKAIMLRAFRAQDSIAFEVRDNGIGIAPREHKRIFQRFYQVDKRLARETGGCGLGLAIVASIVRAHGGKVEVRSRPGDGSVFTVSLPLEVPRQRAAA
jgi:signal transduction histidine kinase